LLKAYLHASEALLGFANAPCLENTSGEDLIDAEIGRFDAMADAVAEELAAMTSVRTELTKQSAPKCSSDGCSAAAT
jgi:hypothetical protein